MLQSCLPRKRVSEEVLNEADEKEMLMGPFDEEYPNSIVDFWTRPTSSRMSKHVLARLGTQ